MFHLTLKSVKGNQLANKAVLEPEILRMLFGFKQTRRLLVFWFVVLKFNEQTFKTMWLNGIYNFMCARAPQTRVGEVGFSLHF